MHTLPPVIRTMPIRWKLRMGFLMLVGGLAIAAVATTGLHFFAAQRAVVTEAERVAAEIVTRSDELPTHELGLLQPHIESLGKLFDHDLFLVNRQGVVVASTNDKSVGTSYREPDVLAALGDGKPRAFVGPDISEPGNARQVAVPLLPRKGGAETGIRGVVVFEYTQFYDTVMAELLHATLMTVLVTALLSLVGWVFSRMITKSVVKPLISLEGAVTAVAGGDYSARIQVYSDDEVGRLTTAFNTMSAALQRGQAEVEDRNAKLLRSHDRLQESLERQREASLRIEHLAYRDELTSLPNRAQFSVALSQAVERAKRDQQPFGVFFVDLDRFKQINDTLGHDAGDALLKEVGARLRHALRGVDTVARLGGDEFVVLVEQLRDDRHAQRVARKILAAIARPMALPGQELRVTASVGISRYDRDGADEQSLMKTADIAMYQVKENGKNGFAFYSEERNGNSFERLAMESSLRRALERNELELHYQPKQHFDSGEVTGMEALLRWRHPELGLVSPAQFIPVAEETGLIVPIGKWVLREACKQTMAWRERGLSDLVVAVNLSPRQFGDDNLLNDIVAILHETGMDGRWLELEITESAITQDVEGARRLLRSLKSLGLRVAVDDFGTGYSSLSTLKLFPIDTLKIDRSFISDVTTDAEDRGLTEAIIQMAKTLRLRTVAEGVETEAQRRLLEERGCDELQGYLFSKPLPAGDFEPFVQLHRLALPDLQAKRLSECPTGW